MGKIAGSALLALCLAAGAHAAPLGTVTIADGRAHVTRGVAVLTPAEGVILEEGDIVEVEEGALLQVETADGSALSFASRAQALLPLPGAAGKPGDLLLAAGWVKLNLTTAAQVPALATAQVRLVGQNAIYVATAGADGTQLFSESGELVPVFAAARAGQPAVIKGGDFIAIRPDAGVSMARRAPPTFVAAMPKVYLDRLPMRLARLKAKGIPMKAERDIAFADVDVWVRRFPAARAALLAQFEPLLKDAAFVQQLEPALKDYPEWEQAVHPAKPRNAKDKAPKKAATKPQ
ncbi:MAG: hypothetical protein JWN73_4556 [Betaproteobacteria bacterium]|nr:hypothetical protein [Betaproteobacteria bacterium]